MLWVLVLGLAQLVAAVAAQNYSICHEFAGNDFFDYFYFWKYADPTRGKVDYVDKKTAKHLNLSYVDPDTGRFVMQVDYAGEAVPINGNQSDLGRRSTRIHSDYLYGDGVYILKATWMPQGCATWPAFWTNSPRNWPQGGEIDVVEGVNGKGANLASLHTVDGCEISPNTSSWQQGNTQEANCSYQPGCSTRFDNIASFGLGFNGNGGGYFAMVRDTTVGGRGIGVWFWPASLNASSIPVEVVAPTKQAPGFVDMEDAMKRWGRPQAFFGADTGNGTSCPMNELFSKHEIVFDTTLCGYWGTGAFELDATCPNMTCQDFVVNNGSLFKDARWEVDYLRIYSNGCQSLESPDNCPDGKRNGKQCSSARMQIEYASFAIKAGLTLVALLFGSFFLELYIAP